jgi:hypothetical protein
MIFVTVEGSLQSLPDFFRWPGLESSGPQARPTRSVRLPTCGALARRAFPLMTKSGGVKIDSNEEIAQPHDVLAICYDMPIKGRSILITRL